MKTSNYKLSKITYKTGLFFSTQLYLLRLMFSTCPIKITVYWILTAVIESVPIISVWLWKILLDTLTIIYTEGITDKRIYVLLVTYLVLHLLASLIGNIRDFLKQEIYDLSNLKLDKNIMRQGAQLESAYMNDPKNSDRVAWTLWSQYSIVSNFTWTVNTITQIIAFLTSIVIFLSYSPLFGILYLVTYIPGVIISYRVGKKSEKMHDRWTPFNRQKEYYKGMLIGAKSAKDIRLYNLTSYLKEKYIKVWNNIRDENNSLFMEGTKQSIISSLISTTGLIAVVILSVRNLMNGSMTAIGTFSLYIGYAKTCSSTFVTLINSIVNQFTIIAPRIQACKEFCEQKATIPDNGTETVPRMPRVEFKNVTFTYPGSDTPALKNMSFVIESGEVVALIGVNGAGKTTIVKLLLRFYEPDSGEILLNGKNIKEFTLASLRHVFGVCFQDVIGYALSLKENIILSDIDRPVEPEALETAAKLSGLDKIMKEWSLGWDTQMTREFSDDGKELSGGQWQKVGLARTFYGNADIIILDEPSSALDAEAEDAIFSSFSELCRNKGGILISHRLSSVIMVNKILFINGGCLEDTGTHSELMKRCQSYAHLYTLQAEKYVGGKDES